MKKYKRQLTASELSHKIAPDNEKFEIIKHRLFYYFTPRNGGCWERIGQGRYNWLLHNNYKVSYVDNAVMDDSEF